jgi:hypothetical protein
MANKTLAAPVLVTPQIDDSNSSHQYIVGVANLSADQSTVYPLLSADDTFVFDNHAATLKNKTISSPTFQGTCAGASTVNSTVISAASINSAALIASCVNSAAISADTTGFFHTASTEVFNSAVSAASTFEDLSLSAVVGANRAFVFLQATASTGSSIFAFRPKGLGGTFNNHINSTGYDKGCCAWHPRDNGDLGYFCLPTDSAGVIQIGASKSSITYRIWVMGYIL